MIPFNKVGHATWMGYSENQMKTRGLTIREAARKANIRCVLGFEFVYLDDARTKYAEAREKIGQQL